MRDYLHEETIYRGRELSSFQRGGYEIIIQDLDSFFQGEGFRGHIMEIRDRPFSHIGSEIKRISWGWPDVGIALQYVSFYDGSCEINAALIYEKNTGIYSRARKFIESLVEKDEKHSKF